MIESLKIKVDNLPKSPGVYLFKDSKGDVIYVGKAKSLRNRVGSYFQISRDKGVKLARLVERIRDLDTIVTDNELEALILESTLIKDHKPKFNVTLKDDKSYPYLRITIQEKFPGVYVWRQPLNDGSLYFGPYSSGGAVRTTLKLLNKIFLFRDCSNTKFSNRSRPCLNYQIGICPAPCVNYISEAEYKSHIGQVILFLKGKDKELIKSLKEKMDEESEKQSYEEAGKIRDRLNALDTLLERQKVVSREQVDRDIFAIIRHEDHLEILILFVRNGTLIGKKGFHFIQPEISDEEAFSTFLTQYYSAQFIPNEIVLPFKISSENTLRKFLKEKKGREVLITVPKQGVKKKFLLMAQTNVKQQAKLREQTTEDVVSILNHLQASLKLSNLPSVIECYDISTFHGSQSYGSQVTFRDGLPDKSRYRLYKIRRVEGMDDFAMLKEVLERRFKPSSERMSLPDLVIIDGGKGQLGIAQRVLRELEVENVDLIALAKAKTESAFRSTRVDKTEERVFIPNRKNPIIFKFGPALHLLERIRDECHRFGISHHRKARGREEIKSALDDIPGIGPAKKRALIKHFGSIEAIRKSSIEELQNIRGITPTLAEVIKRHLTGE
ncbi:MAG: excinuclease ABC subunit C [Deltaproteobacteria bacterium RIFCSPHIGHO2_12_FULL_43_9]|nr:MAG: excinuclease ABC subunit C [Deltaproteobacteria bacterium RIFCSPHIGHO2_12_FULL_43_9]